MPLVKELVSQNIGLSKRIGMTLRLAGTLKTSIFK